MLFTQNHAQFFDDNGDPLNGGVVKFFEPGTSTSKDVYSDGNLTTSIGSEVTLDSAGRAAIFLNGNYKVTLENSSGVVVKTVDDVNVQADPVTLILTNPSFETAGDSATDIPGWTLSAPSGVTAQRVTTDNFHGAACLEIVSDGTNAGHGETTDFIPVSPGREYEISFGLESSSATVTNTVQLRWFDESQNLVTTTSVYDASSGNPTSFETKVFTATPPATARYAKIRAQLGATAGTTRYDDFGLEAQALLYARTDEINTAGQSPDDIDFSGLYYVGGGLSGSPTGNVGYVWHTQGPDADTAGQVWLDGTLDNNARKLYYRVKSSGTWTTWQSTLDPSSTGSDPGLAFGTWRTPNANRPTAVNLMVRAETDGTTDGLVEVDVDESGGTSKDYTVAKAFADNAAGAHIEVESIYFVVPAGGAYQIVNSSDPASSNAIQMHREFTL